MAKGSQGNTLPKPGPGNYIALPIFTMKMRIKSRYKFWHVLIATIGLVMTYFILNSLPPLFENPEKSAAEQAVAKQKRFDQITWYDSLTAFVYHVFLFYFALNYYYNLIVANKKILSFFKVTAVIVIISYVIHLILYYYIPAVPETGYHTPGKVFSTLLSSLIPLLFICWLFAYVSNMREAVKQRRILQEQKLQLEAQISQANFNFLKAQINPHFLHNTLNFLYSKSLPYSAELSEGILTLSDIMRYALSQGIRKDGKTSLKDEIEHVRNVIKISQLRYSNQLKVNFDVTGNINGKITIPFVLITLVENAFKHGDLKDPDNPIDIAVNVQRNRLFFYCRNKKKSGPKQLSTGIGLENIRKRLDLAYGENYKYIVGDEPDFYTVELTIDKL